jgi:outer membrane immunogenic protein
VQTTAKALLAAMASAAVIHGACAADMPLKAPVAPVLFSWTGCYAGVNGGRDYRRDRVHLEPTGNYGNRAIIEPPNNIGSGDPPTLPFLTHDYSQSGSGGTVGGTLGCQQQQGSWVLGIEGDLNWANAKTTVDAAYAPFPDRTNPAFPSRPTPST